MVTEFGSWILGAALLCLFIGGSEYRSRGTYAWTGIASLLAAIALVPLGIQALPGIYAASGIYGIATLLLKFLLGWVIAGLIVGPLYWISFVRRLAVKWRDQTEKYVQENKPEMHAKLEAFSDLMWKYSKIRLPDTLWGSFGCPPRYGIPSSLDSITNWTPELVSECQAALEEALPPKAIHNKALIIHFGVIWPITLSAMIFGDIFAHIQDAVFALIRKGIDKAAAAVFGKV